jgi:hypothetical protein
MERLMAVGGKRHALAGRKQLHDRVRAHRAFTGARRTLHDEIASIECTHDRRERFLADALGLNVRAARAIRKPRQTPEQQFECGRIVAHERACRICPRNILDRRAFFLVVDRLFRNERAQPGGIRRGGKLDLQRSGDVVQRNDLTRAFAGRDVERRAADAHVVFLFGIPERVHEAAVALPELVGLDVGAMPQSAQ